MMLLDSVTSVKAVHVCLSVHPALLTLEEWEVCEEVNQYNLLLQMFVVSPWWVLPASKLQQEGYKWQLAAHTVRLFFLAFPSACVDTSGVLFTHMLCAVVWISKNADMMHKSMWVGKSLAK